MVKFKVAENLRRDMLTDMYELLAHTKVEIMPINTYIKSVLKIGIASSLMVNVDDSQITLIYRKGQCQVCKKEGQSTIEYVALLTDLGIHAYCCSEECANMFILRKL